MRLISLMMMVMNLKSRKSSLVCSGDTHLCKQKLFFFLQFLLTVNFFFFCEFSSFFSGTLLSFSYFLNFFIFMSLISSIRLFQINLQTKKNTEIKWWHMTWEWIWLTSWSRWHIVFLLFLFSLLFNF